MSRRRLCLLVGLAAALAIPAGKAAAQENAAVEPTPLLGSSFSFQSRMAGTVFARSSEPGPGLSAGEDRSWALETRQEVGVMLKVAEAALIVQRAAVSTSDRQSAGAGDSVTNPGIIESFIALTPLPGARIAAGIVQPSFGNSFFFNATDWLSRYALDPPAPGAGSFLGLDAQAGLGEWTLSLTLIPAFADSGLGLFNEKPVNHIAALKVSRLFEPANVAGTLFGEAAPDFGRLFGGAGLEVQTPLGESVSIDAQVLVSNGWRAFALSQTAGILVLAERDASESEVFTDASVDLEWMIASLLLARIGYRYSGRGIAAESVKRLRTEGYALARQAGLDALLPAYASVLGWPPSVLDHVMAFSLAIPRVTETLGASLTAFASPFDPSAWTRFALSWAPTESIQVELSAEAGLGAEGSLFRPFRQEAAFSLSFEVSM